MARALGANYTILAIFQIITIALFAFYIIGIGGLNYKRTYGLTTTDFTVETNDVDNAKWWFITVVPIVTIVLALGLFLARTVAIKLLDIAGMNAVGDNTSNLIDTDKTELIDGLYALKIIHIVFSIIALLALIASFVFLCIDATNCISTTTDKNNLCTDPRFCCASDVHGVIPGITNRCPYVTSCAAITMASTDLPWDLYFTFTFIMTIVFLIIIAVHIGIGFIMDFGELGSSSSKLFSSMEKVNSKIGGKLSSSSTITTKKNEENENLFRAL